MAAPDRGGRHAHARPCEGFYRFPGIRRVVNTVLAEVPGGRQRESRVESTTVRPERVGPLARHLARATSPAGEPWKPGATFLRSFLQGGLPWLLATRWSSPPWSRWTWPSTAQ